MVDESITGPECWARVDREQQPSIGHQAVVLVKRDLDAIGMVAWLHLLGASLFPETFFCFKTIIPAVRGAPSAFFKGCPQVTSVPEVVWSSRESKAVETADIVAGALEVPVRDRRWDWRSITGAAYPTFSTRELSSRSAVEQLLMQPGPACAWD